MSLSDSDRTKIILDALNRALPQLSSGARQRLAEEMLRFGQKAIHEGWNLDNPDFRLGAYRVDRSTELSRALVQARRRAGVETSAVVTATRWSPSKLSRIESGEVSISVTDMLFLITLYGVTDDATRRQLIVLTEADRKRRQQRR